MNNEEAEMQGRYRIASVERDIKKRSRYLIYTEQSEEPILSVHEDILVQYRLLKGQSLTSAELSEIIDADRKQSAYALAVAYLGIKPRTRKEIERYLQRKELDPDVINSALDRLEAERTIDDGEYAAQFAEQRLRLQSKGRLAIKQELLLRGISKSQAADAIAGLDEATELTTAVRAGTKKWPFIKGEHRDRKQKLALFLMRKGYPGSVVKEAVKQVSAEALTDDEGQMLDN
ncbi:RecX family transcriptional regulator [Paenibacillus tarimensis]